MTAAKPTTLNEALSALQGDLPRVVMDRKANTGTYSYKYAGLPDVTDALLPVLSKHGLAFTARPTIDGDRFVLAYALHHTSGENLVGVYPLPDPARSTPQQIGSAITYGRRYCLLAVTGLAPDPDDDGQAASYAPAGGRMEQPRKAERGPLVEDPWADAEIAKPPVVTDAVWWKGWQERVVLTSSLAELRGLFGEMAEQHKTRNLTDEDRAEAERLIGEVKEQIQSEGALIAETEVSV